MGWLRKIGQNIELKIGFRGLTLPELLVASALLLVVIGTAYELLYFGERQWRMASGATEAQVNLRLAVNRVSKDLREAKTPPDNSEAIPLAEKGEITFYANVDEDASPERIHYLIEGAQLIRGITQHDQATGYGGQEARQAIARQVRVFSLRYFDKNSNFLGLPLNSGGRADVRLVLIVLETDTDPNEPPPGTRAESQVRLRNFSRAD